MTRDEARKAAEVMLAWADGKEIEFRSGALDWDDIPYPNFDWDNNNYRIKPSPKYRPFKDAEECWQEMQKHQPFGWVKTKAFGDYSLIKEVTSLYVAPPGDAFGYTEIMNDYIFADGTPFGAKEEEA